MSEGERETYDLLVNQTKPEINKHRRWVIIGSTVIFLLVLITIVRFWIIPTVTITTSLLIGGQLYALWGALLLVLGAVSSPPTLGLMSMTKYDGNSKLFAELMKSRFSAIVGISFIVGGFSIQAVALLAVAS